MLITTAIIVVTVLMLIKLESTNIYPLNERQETNVLHTFNNIRNELIRAGRITISSKNYNPVYDFSNFVYQKEDSQIFYSISDFNADTLNITVANFLNDTVQNVQISQNLTGETKSISSLSVGSMDWVSFTSSPTTEEDVQVNISYEKSSSVFNYTFITKVSPSKRYISIFYDFRLNYGNSFVRDEFQTIGQPD